MNAAWHQGTPSPDREWTGAAWLVTERGRLGHTLPQRAISRPFDLAHTWHEATPETRKLASDLRFCQSG
jgi:hypothetical protein